MDYKDTVFLPKTEFPMRAGLPRKEPEILKIWEEQKIYQTLRKKRSSSEKYILHDGPPYANGNLHMGTALNKILKDIINRFYSMLGKDANYVPGWDCHGLPIEWKIEEKYRKKGQNKDTIPIIESLRIQNNFTCLSTGGGSLLKFIEGKDFPILSKLGVYNK